jgi:brefeldin A-resistance guanine nucleotide exchange factor 1
MRFNESPKAGIEYLASEGVIEDPQDPHSVASFLTRTTRISKRVLGEYLSKKSHEKIFEAFLDQFDFTGRRVDEALRALLESFRLPGEAPLIDRIVTQFSGKYCASSPPDGVADKDAVYVLTYAIIMLNTDQHNPNVKGQKRMSYDDFARNLRGVNGGGDFAPEYLQEIYESIKNREIILPDEHDNKQAFDYAWKQLLLKAGSTTDLIIHDQNTYDADMFGATWRPIVATLSYVFMSATDDAVFSRVVTGFDQCARIAATYELYDALDHIIFVLGLMSTLASDSPLNTSLNTEIQAGDQKVMVSELAVRLGRDFKAQLATVVLFRVVMGNESAIRDGWKTVSTKLHHTGTRVTPKR